MATRSWCSETAWSADQLRTALGALLQKLPRLSAAVEGSTVYITIPIRDAKLAPRELGYANDPEEVARSLRDPEDITQTDYSIVFDLEVATGSDGNVYLLTLNSELNDNDQSWPVANAIARFLAGALGAPPLDPSSDYPLFDESVRS